MKKDNIKSYLRDRRSWQRKIYRRGWSDTD